MAIIIATPHASSTKLDGSGTALLDPVTVAE